MAQLARRGTPALASTPCTACAEDAARSRTWSRTRPGTLRGNSCSLVRQVPRNSSATRVRRDDLGDARRRAPSEQRRAGVAVALLGRATRARPGGSRRPRPARARRCPPRCASSAGEQRRGAGAQRVGEVERCASSAAGRAPRRWSPRPASRRTASVVVAKKTASGARPSAGERRAPRSTASVRLSSSWLATAFSPGPGTPPHSRAISSRGRR